MTVFKTFLKILNKCKIPIIMYTVFLIAFGGFNMQTSDNSTNFVSSKPDILIINYDDNTGLTKNLINYINDNANIVEIKDDEEKINDALFYRDINYVIYIPENYRNDFLNKKNPEIKIKSTGDYQSSYAEMLLNRYIKVANVYVDRLNEEDEIIAKINNTLTNQTKIEVTSKLNTDSLSKATFYYNFASYSILAGVIYVICLILSSFNNEKIKKRTIISSMDYKKHNRILLLSNSLFAFVLWLFYVLLSFILIKDVMFQPQSIIYLINSLVFTMCSVTIAFFISSLVNNKEAINGIVNVVALGSSFLCGAFVPIEWLPNSVLTIAKFLPSYWYIQTNELVNTLETINVDTLKPVFINVGVLLIFSLGFIIISNVFSRRKRIKKD